jgi:hypothetical protein
VRRLGGAAVESGGIRGIITFEVCLSAAGKAFLGGNGTDRVDYCRWPNASFFFLFPRGDAPGYVERGLWPNVPRLEARATCCPRGSLRTVRSSRASRLGASTAAPTGLPPPELTFPAGPRQLLPIGAMYLLVIISRNALASGCRPEFRLSPRILSADSGDSVLWGTDKTACAVPFFCKMVLRWRPVTTLSAESRWHWSRACGFVRSTLHACRAADCEKQGAEVQEVPAVHSGVAWHHCSTTPLRLHDSVIRRPPLYDSAL